MSCRFDIYVGFPFREIRMDAGFSASQLTVVTPTLTHINFNNWTNSIYCSGKGDVHVGTPAHGRGVASLGQSQAVNTHCGSGFSVNGLTTLLWQSGILETTEDTTLRIQMGMEGGFDVGWRWVSGVIYVRNGAPNVTITTTTTNSGVFPSTRLTFLKYFNRVYTSHNHC